MMQETCGKHVKYVTGECMLFVPIRKEDNDNFDNCDANRQSNNTNENTKKNKQIIRLTKRHDT